MQFSSLIIAAIALATTQIKASPAPRDVHELAKRDYYTWDPDMYDGTIDQFATIYCTDPNYHCVTVKVPNKSSDNNEPYPIARGTYGFSYLHPTIPLSEEIKCIDRDPDVKYLKRTCAYDATSYIQYVCQEPHQETDFNSLLMVDFSPNYSNFSTWLAEGVSETKNALANFIVFDADKIQHPELGVSKLQEEVTTTVTKQNTGESYQEGIDIEVFCGRSSN